VGKPHGIFLLERMKRWKDNIKLDLKEILCDNRRWMELAQDCDEYSELWQQHINRWTW
jgi:hypothetical protein